MKKASKKKVKLFVFDCAHKYIVNKNNLRSIIELLLNYQIIMLINQFINFWTKYLLLWIGCRPTPLIPLTFLVHDLKPANFFLGIV